MRFTGDEERRLDAITLEKTKLDAKFHGTTIDKLDQRKGMTSDLTKYQNEFHKKMSSFALRRLKLKKSTQESKRVALQKEFANFELRYFDVNAEYQLHYRYKGDTSENTKRIETRPLKRDTNVNYNLDSYRFLREGKKIRPSADTSSDSPADGTSTSK